MYIDKISNNNFQGKAYFKKTIGEKEKEFANKILDFEIDGISNRKFLAEKNFDMDFRSYNSKRTIHPKLEIYSLIKYVISGGYCKGEPNLNYNPLDIKLDEGVEKGAQTLREHILNTEKFIEKYYPTHYYTNWQKWQMQLKVLLKKI